MSDITMHANLADLQELQNKLLRLADILKRCYNELTAGRKAMSENWKDAKFDEFYSQFKSSEEKINTIAERYKYWASGPLQLEIDDIIEYEKFRFG